MLLAYWLLILLALLCNFVSAFVQNSASISGISALFNIDGAVHSKVIGPSKNTIHKTTSGDEFALSKAALLKTLEDYRNYYGTNQHWWGDYSAGETRYFYHALLPREEELMGVPGYSKLSVEEKALAASSSRHAARLYARERCTVPGRLLAMAFDGYRTFKSMGKWSPSGMTWDDLYCKYSSQLAQEASAAGKPLNTQELNTQTCLKILEKACKTNTAFDTAFDSAGALLEGGRQAFKPSVLLLSLMRFV
mmetsp:Transcript_7076/g.10632  ORF Transcript_7076/g.10632 Transcript_7076/m.10632 type:complete len:250 (+) Transcript_7076:224-973(+)|eukprot:CAMPEP_0194575142 /NCGR_PEP_ID=MMETSP0292-20121207/10719_1 /TAXON_ID=39354 /ORGANISM="Heterosigma akashiwo, Strain CCMP2393" /LENGTH=249 /DNA_ID=CAMNT_0039426819 /DNA_START=215 /DNA_END=964 /DNA_ORIENTATION=+